jgi:hypothetical protein
VELEKGMGLFRCLQIKKGLPTGKPYYDW